MLNCRITRFSYFALCLVLAASFTNSRSIAAAPVDGSAKPNIILINLDDADTDMFSDTTLAERFPHLSQLAARSVKFTNAHATTPLCGPSRACLLRAQYAHHCQIRVNEPHVPAAFGFDGGMRSYVERGYAEDDLSTWMQGAGYHTIQVGKFLHHESLFMVPDGWDDFYSSLGGKYFETFRITNRNGPGPYAETIEPGVYRTDAEAAEAVELINRRVVADDKPFFMFLNPFGPHRQQVNSGKMYDPKYEDLWPDIDLPASPSYDEADLSDLSGPIRTMPALTERNHEYYSTHYRERMLAMKSVDDMVGRIVATLDARGLTENTYIFVTSDNGFVLGHHRLSGKGFSVNRATNIPLLVAGPGVSPGVSDHLVAHIDLGPTIVDLAGGVTPEFADGTSFARLMANPQATDGVRDHVLIENFETRVLLGKRRRFASTSIRFRDSLYNEWASGGREYFDLASDPEQLTNIYPSLSLAARRELAATLRTTKNWAPSEASFEEPYENMQQLEYPYVLRGIAEATVSMNRVPIAVWDVKTRKYWNGTEWVSNFHQVEAKLNHQNAMLSYWELPLNFGPGQYPEGRVAAWVWGLDYTRNYQAPDSVVFTLGDSKSEVTLSEPNYKQRYSGTVRLYGIASEGVSPDLDEVELKIRNVEIGLFWDGTSFVNGYAYLPAEVANGKWSYTTSTLPPGTYRVSVNGRDSDGNVFDVTHRLFYVD